MSSDSVRHFDHHTTWKDVKDMTIDEAVVVLSRFANSDGRDWSARPHLAKACQMAVEALLKQKELYMKQAMEFDFDKFVEKLKEMNLAHGHKSLGDDPSDEDIWVVKGYQDCLEDVINVFRECME